MRNVCSRSPWPAAAVVAVSVVTVALGSAHPAFAASEHEKRVDAAVKKAVGFLMAQQQTEKILLITGQLREHKNIEVDGAWKDVQVVAKGRQVIIKGRKYDDVLGALPPGWFAPEPVLGLQRTAVDQMAGHTALITLALLAAGGNPNQDPKLMMAVDCLLNMVAIHTTDPKIDWELQPGPVGTYALALRAAALECALRKTKAASLRGLLIKAVTRDAKMLTGGYVKDGGWTYTMRDPTKKSFWDLSNTQYGILGLWAADRAGVELSDAVWKHFNQLLIDTQEKDGGWTYYPAQNERDNEAKPTMTQAGIASLFLFMDVLHTRTRGAGRPDVSPFSPELLKTLQALDRAMENFGRVYAPDANDGYYMYGAERIGVAGGYKYFGKSDWYRDGAVAVLDAQRGDGSWSGRKPAYASGATAWNLLFLVYGNAPVLINKLRHGPADDWSWHNYPRDAGNVCGWFEATYETRYNWQIVTLDGKFSDLTDAPILYISGHTPVSFSDKEIKRLRRYVEVGGTLLFVASGGKRPFIDSVLELSRKIYPPELYPERQFTELPDNHPLYSINLPPNRKQATFARMPIWHMADGARSFAFLVPDDVNHVWHCNRPSYRRECFDFVGNLSSYVLDRAPAPPRIRDRITFGEPKASGALKPIRVGLVKFRSSGKTPVQKTVGKGNPEPTETLGDWTAAAEAWYIFSEWLEHVAGLEVKDKFGVELTATDLGSYDVLHMSGRRSFQLSDAEKAALKSYVEGGGTVLFDTPGGQGTEFTQSANALCRELFGDKFATLTASSPVITGEAGGLREVGKGFGLSRQAKLNRPDLNGPAEVLKGVTLDNRVAVVLCSWDLTYGMMEARCWGRQGFSPRTTRDLLGNLLMQAHTRRSR